MNRKIKIIHLEDLPSDAHLISKSLQKAGLNFEILVVDNRKKFVKALDTFSPDLILADHSLPVFNSHEALAILRERGLKIPFILVTSTMTDEFAVDAMKRGADDYILKDRPERLPAAIHNALEKYRLENERNIVLEELAINEKRYRALIENSADGVLILSAEGKPIYASASVEKILGYNTKEILQSDLFSIAHQDDIVSLSGVMEQLLAYPGVTMKGHTARFLHKDGSWRWLEGTVTNMLDDPAIHGIVDNFRDVTEKKLAEEKIVHLNRLYAFISQINQAIVHASDQQTILQKSCRTAIEIGKFKAAWIAKIDLENQRINYIEGFGIGDEDLPKFTNVLYNPKGPQAHVIKTGTYYICNNIRQDLPLKDWRDFAAVHGFSSVMVLPLRKSGNIFATFNLYAAEIDFFTTEEIKLLVGATEDISYALDIFETRKQKVLADERIKQKKLHLNRAQAIAHLGSWEFDFATGVTLWSDELLRIYGFSPGESKQTRDAWLSFIHPADLDYVKDAMQDAELNNQNSSFFHRIIRKDGHIRYLHSYSNITLDSKGIPVGQQGVGHDVTEIKEAEEALRESESNLSAIFENTSEGFILTDTNGIIKAFNQNIAVANQLNNEKAIKIGDSIFDFINPSRKDLYTDSIAKVLAGEVLQYEYPYDWKNGEKKWFSFTINPVYKNSMVKGLSITSADITNRKRAEELLKESEMFNKGILASLSAHITVIDVHGNVISVNKAWNDFANANGASSLRRTSEGSNYFEVCKRSIAIGEPIAGEALNGILSVINGDKKSFEMEYPCHSPKEQRWFVMNVLKFGTDGSKVVVSHQNVTKRKKAQELLKLSQMNLTAVLENTDAAIYSLDKNLRYLTFNQRYFEKMKEIYGYEISTGQHIYALLENVEPKEAAGWKEIYAKALSGETIKFEKEYNYGVYSCVSFSIYPIWENQEVVGLSNFSVDTTNQRLMTNALRQSQANLNALFTHTEIGLILLDGEFKVLSCNETGIKWVALAFGSTIQEGEFMVSLLKDEQTKGAEQLLTKIINGIAYHEERSYINQNGDLIWYRIQVNPIHDKEGVTYGVCISVNNITSRKLAEIRILEANENLEIQVKIRTAEVVRQKEELEIRNLSITSSINYAKRIQQAILPPIERIRKHFPDSFVLYLPKDVVSGDLYFFKEQDDEVAFASIDCTGHGVPGALMSTIANDLLNGIIEIGTTNPGKILTKLNQDLKRAFRQHLASNEISDGMDIALCTYSKTQNLLQFAGAKRSLILMRKAEHAPLSGHVATRAGDGLHFYEFPPSRCSIGGFTSEKFSFETTEIHIIPGDTIYLYTDGYADQFGEQTDKKFMVRNFKELLLSIQQESMALQGKILEDAFEQWKGNARQTDDVLVMGFRFD